MTTVLLQAIPDILTLLRVLLALLLAGAALDGQPALGRDIWLLVMAWTTDMADGRISRLLPERKPSWLGRNDVYIDLLVSVAALIYLVLTNLLSVWVAVAYLLVWSVLFIRWGSIPHLAAQVFQNPIYVLFLIFTLQAEMGVLPWLLLWAALCAVLFGRRVIELYHETVRSLRT